MLSFRTVVLSVWMLSGLSSSLHGVMAADGAQGICLNLVESHCDGSASTEVMDTCVSSGILECARPDFCGQPSETGMCRAAFPRFFFNTESGGCEEFIYGGCQGNTNNFETQAGCEDACKGLRYCGGSSGASCPDKFECDSGLCVPTPTKR